MAKRPEEEATPEISPKEMSRREFLNYAWGASILLFMAELGVLSYLFAYPRFREGEFGGTFTLNAGAVPPTGASPADNPDGKFWLSHTDDGVKALYKVCTHLGCLYKWVETNERFECPCHGSKFQLDGTYIEGPAPRNLDQFPIAALDEEGNELAQNDDNTPLQLPEGTAVIRVDTGNRVRGRSV